ncbi:MAG: ABC transporter ATP-binding protein [Nocardiaceae bacterium]|nr:ABC transporter ATP-binding protein [Nocardiaceae bacterium]
MILEVDKLDVSYGRVRAVREVSFQAAAGSLVAIIGANGAGKSSLMNAVAGLLKPKSGRVVFDGRDVTGWPSHRLVRQGLVLVPEGRAVLGTMTVAENLQLGGWNRSSILKASIDEIYSRFPVLGERRKLPASALSGGEQQLLAIARAMLAKPRVILMDEPSMGLAPRAVDEVFRVIEEIRSTGTTVVLVEQNARRALRAADTGYVLEVGEVAHSGPADELLHDQRIVHAYLGLE